MSLDTWPDAVVPILRHWPNEVVPPSDSTLTRLCILRHWPNEIVPLKMFFIQKLHIVQLGTNSLGLCLKDGQSR